MKTVPKNLFVSLPFLKWQHTYFTDLKVMKTGQVYSHIFAYIAYTSCAFYVIQEAY